MKVALVSRSGREIVKGGIQLSDSATVADLQEAIHKRKHFSDFLTHYQYENISFLQSIANTAEVHQEPFVLVAHIIEIVATNAFGLVVNVEDHTGTAILALRGDAAFDFYEEHLRSPDHPDPITDPYALDDTWFGTYLFRIDSATQIIIESNYAFIVPKLCMKTEIVDNFIHYQMNQDECLCYRRSMALAVLCGGYNGNDGLQVSPSDSRILRLGMGTGKRVHAPYMP